MPQIDYNLLTLAIGTGSLILLLLELRSNHRWNQKRASYEMTFAMLTTGRFTGTMEELQTRFSWDLLASNETYADVIARPGLASAEIQRIDRELIVILRHLEALSICISHGIVDEFIAWDVFWGFYERIYASTHPFIEKERARRSNPDIYTRFEHYALKWRNAPLDGGARRGRER